MRFSQRAFIVLCLLGLFQSNYELGYSSCGDCHNRGNLWDDTCGSGVCGITVFTDRRACCDAGSPVFQYPESCDTTPALVYQEILDLVGTCSGEGDLSLFCATTTSSTCSQSPSWSTRFYNTCDLDGDPTWTGYSTINVCS